MNVHDALFYLSNSQGRAVWRVGGWGYSHSVPMRRNVSRTLRWAYAACRPHAATQRRPPPPAPRQPRRASSFRERARRAMRRATAGLRHGENLRHKRVVARHGHHTCAKPGVYGTRPHALPHYILTSLLHSSYSLSYIITSTLSTLSLSLMVTTETDCLRSFHLS